MEDHRTIGNCELCDKLRHLNRKCFFYDVNCDCCEVEHVKVIKHCDDCQPTAPNSVTIEKKHMYYDDDLNRMNKVVENMWKER